MARSAHFSTRAVTRGAQLLSKTNANTRVITCPYHSWSYGSDGCLRGMPGREGFCDHDVETLGLLNYSCEERYGLIWVRLSPNGGHTESSWDEWFAPLNDELHALGIDSHSVFSTRDVVVKANWKVVNDAFMEGYHFRFVHKDSVFPFYCDNQGVFTSLGPHYRYFLADRNMNAQADVPREQRRLRENCLMVYQIFPVSSVQVLADHLFVHSLLPIGQGETLIRNTMLVPAYSGERERPFWLNVNTFFLNASPTEVCTPGVHVQSIS